MLGVIGLQMHVIQVDEETRRRDMANQLLTSGAEMVACSDYGSDELYSGAETTFSGITDGEGGKPLMGWDNKAELYLFHHLSTATLPAVRHVCLVAEWTSVKNREKKSLKRMLIKPQNIIQ